MEVALPQATIEVPPQVLPFAMEDFPAKPSLREVFHAEEGPLLRFAHGLTGRREIAEDLVQEAFLRLHSHWQEVAHPRAWLYRSVRNLALNHLRSQRRESGDELPETADDASSTPDRHLAQQEAAGAVRLLLAEMKEDDRQLLTLKYQENLKYDQISQRTGLSVGNVGYKLHHLLKALADNLRRLGIDSPEG